MGHFVSEVYHVVDCTETTSGFSADGWTVRTVMKLHVSFDQNLDFKHFAVQPQQTFDAVC